MTLISKALVESDNVAGFTHNASSEMRNYGLMNLNAGYGENFSKRIKSDKKASIKSFGNGAAMRVSAIAWWFDDLDIAKEYATALTKVTHNSKDAIDGANAVVEAILLARNREP